MGFLTTGTTVEVTATLTDAGKKKIYESIEHDSSGFVTKFAIGDSDNDYAATAGGAVRCYRIPEPSDFKPNIRSFALYTGQYRPGIPVLLINDEYGTDNGVTTLLSIGANVQTQFLYNITTEWPKNEAFSDEYTVILQNPGNLSLVALMAQYISLGYNVAEQRWIFQFSGGASIEQLRMLIGEPGSGNSTTIPVKIIGKTTNAKIMLNIELVE